MILSVIIPAYNEARTISLILDKVLEVDLIGDIQKELIVVNDASTDDTKSIVESYIKTHEGANIKFFSHEVNQGKGGALHTGIKEAGGDFVIIQDADLEYDPEEFNILLRPILDGYADVVYCLLYTSPSPRD